MNRSIVMMISAAAMDTYFFACNTVMPRIIYHGPGFEE
jgi:hypothetical protein